MSDKNCKRIVSLAASITLVLSILSSTFINASANNNSPKATFSYGNYAGVEEAIGTNPDDIPISGDSITLPDNTNSMNLYWKNGRKTYKAGTEISVSELTKDNSGNYPFTALFGNISIDYDEIDTEPFTFETGGGKSEDVFFGQLNKNSWWGIPSGYANDGTVNTAFGASNFSIRKKDGSGTDNNLVLGQWAKSGTYFNAALFTHSPFDSSDENSHNSKATGKLEYKYVYFTPGVEYTLSFDYKIEANGGGEPPYSASIAYGMATNRGDDNCGKKTVEYATGSENRTSVDLGTETGKWKRTSVSIKAPESYTGNGVTSARVGISLKVKTSGGCYIDNVKLQVAGTRVTFSYGEAAGTSEVFGENLYAFADDDGNFTIPSNDSAKNLLWKHGNNLYSPGTNLNIKQFGDDLTFHAYFAGASLDFEDIYTNNIKLAGGQANVNMFGELSRVGSYWKIPQGLSNTDDNGLALGDGSAGIIPSSGKKGKGLRFESRPTKINYYNAVLFAHSPTSFGLNDNITYSYVYYSPDTEYKMEFDYKSDSKLDVAVAFGVNTATTTAKCGTNSVNSASYDDEGNHITLEATNGEWKHASITVQSPSAYIGNGSTSARVGIAVKNYYTADYLYSYFDNVRFYPTAMECYSAKIQYGSETDSVDSQTVTFFKAKAPLKSNNTVLLPSQDDVLACFRSGNNDKGLWTAGYGTVSNLLGWKLLETDKIYSPQDAVQIADLPANPVFTAVYGDANIDFESVDENFKIFNSNSLTYGADKAKIIRENENSYVRLEQENTNIVKQYNQILMFTEAGKFAAYNVDSLYKVTFKYRRIDTTNAESRIYFSFGSIPFDWRARSNSISKSEVCVTKAGMSDFETVSVIVKSPSKHVYIKGVENFYSRAMAIGVELSDGVKIDIDDINIEAVDLSKENIGTATFDFGSSDITNDSTDMKFASSLILPGKTSPTACTRKGTNTEGKKWQAGYGYVTNQTAWYCKNNKKYYELGEKVASSEIGNNPSFLAVYENGKVDFDNLEANFNFKNGGKTSYSANFTKLMGDTNKYVNITGGESHKNNSVQIILFNEPEGFLSYNLGKTYKVSFKYRRTDNTDTESQLFFAFGAPAFDWYATSRCVNRISLGNSKRNMTEFETVTAYVTAPDTYEYTIGGEYPEYFYSRTMSVGANISNGVSIDFDDISVEAIGRDEVAMTFSVPDEKVQEVVIGKVGERLSIPNVPIDRNSVIKGWYTDNKFTKPFTLKFFPEEGMVVYGKTDHAKVRYYGFTDYPWDSSPAGQNQYARKDHHIIEKGFSSDGDGYALKIDNTYEGASIEQQGISIPLVIKPNTKYLISYDFYYEKIGDRSATLSEAWFNTTVGGSVWKGHMQHVTNTDEYVPAAIEEKKWITGYVFGTTTEFTWSNTLALFVRVPVGSIRYIDNIVVTEVSDDDCIAMFKLGSFQSPQPVVAPKNSTIKIPKVKLDNHVFLNWVLKSEDYKEDTYSLVEDTVFTAKTTVRKFGDDFENTDYGKDGLTAFGMELDWEIYDSHGKDSSNVKSGRYSLHRIGKDLRNSAYCFHNNTTITKNSLASGRIYTASFWVKIENPVHKLGSIDIASCISLTNPWDLATERFNVSPIADIADNEWHKLSYTFMSAGEYLTLIVPGNLSIYIDDLQVEYTPDADISKNCSFEEYIPAFLTADGKYIKPDLNDGKLEKFELVKRVSGDADTAAENNNMTLIIVIIASGAVLLTGGVIGTIIFIRKKKKI